MGRQKGRAGQRALGTSGASSLPFGEPERKLQHTCSEKGGKTLLGNSSGELFLLWLPLRAAQLPAQMCGCHRSTQAQVQPKGPRKGVAGKPRGWLGGRRLGT